MGEKKSYDEQRELPSPWEWVIIVIFSLSIMGFGLLVYRLVDDGVRFWDFGQLPDTPAESIYSTETPARGARPGIQIPKLPEAQSGNPPKPPNVHLKEREKR